MTTRILQPPTLAKTLGQRKQSPAGCSRLQPCQTPTPKTSNMGVWQGVAMDSPKFHPGLPCPTLLCPVGGPPLKRPYQDSTAWGIQGGRRCAAGGVPAGRRRVGHGGPGWKFGESVDTPCHTGLGLTAISRVAVLYPFGHPAPYAHASAQAPTAQRPLQREQISAAAFFDADARALMVIGNPKKGERKGGEREGERLID
jgi:hypothetical protein